MKLLSLLCQPRESHTIELFINFMSYYIIQNISREDVMTKLFDIGHDMFQNEIANGPSPESLLNLFTRQLSQTFKYITPLDMRRDNESHIYYLIHGTQHPTGTEHMKSAMKYGDPLAYEQLCSKSPAPLDQIILQYFENEPGQRHKIDDIHNFITTETPFMKGDGTRCLTDLVAQGSWA